MGAGLPDGLLLIDKPAGRTSHDVVAIVRRVTRQRRVGHAGTLDPFATGLLVLLLGRATRLLPYLAGEPKVYDATIVFGHETDTDDLTGLPTRTASPPDRDALDAGVAALSGVIAQEPPAYSAKQVGGRRAYAAARSGAPLTLAPSQVTVHAWDVSAYDGTTLRASITCSGGTYIRALARDIGRAARSAAHLVALRRISSGPFHVHDAVTLDVVAAEPDRHIRPPLDGLVGLPVEAIDTEGIDRVRRGLTVSAVAGGEWAALVDRDRRLIAVAERQGTDWQPRVVLGDEA